MQNNTLNSPSFGNIISESDSVAITDSSGVGLLSQTLPLPVQDNITELGDIVSGTWKATVIDSVYGGTGIDNGSSTITLGGSLTTSGAFASTFTMTGTTNVTFPTSGTLATTSSLPTLPLSLSNGGTGASLAANNGGIFYSAASAGAILSGTATSRQIVLSGSNSAPSWSNATYPASTNINQILYSSAANTITGILTANNSVLTTSAGGVPSLSSSLPILVQANIVEVGVIAAGTWEADAVSPVYGGTGVNNGSSTITLGGNLTVAGAFASTFTMTGPTNVTFPTSGTLATTASFPTLPLSLSNGGTAASLTANNGGIFYSTASAGAILSGTATARQVLLSGSSTAPAWSSATYPSSTTINQILYSSAANVISGISTANSSVMITDSGGAPSFSSGLPSVVQSNIVGVGVLASGTWEADTISPTYGGTGVNNGASTITLGGSLTTTGSFSSTFAMTGPTSVIFPTSGTLATTASIPTFPISLSNGGTGASLTASNGGIFYSTGSAGAILSGTATANQLLISGSSTTPAWTTSTYPATNSANTLLYASSANVMSALATGNNGVLITSGAGVPSIGSTLPTGVQTNITQLGTITVGVWNGTAIDRAHGGTGIITSPTNGQILSGTSGNVWAIGNLNSSASSITRTPDGSGNINLDANSTIIPYLANANTFTADQTLSATHTLFVDNITSTSGDLVLNPSSSSNYVVIGKSLTGTAHVIVGEGSTNVEFRVENSTNTGFSVNGLSVSTLYNNLDDGSGNSYVVGTFKADTIASYTSSNVTFIGNIITQGNITVNSGQTLFTNAIQGITTSLKLNPSASGQIVHLGQSLAVANVYVGTSSTSTNFRVQNNSNIFFSASNGVVNTLNNTLDDGSGNLGAQTITSISWAAAGTASGDPGYFISYPSGVNKGSLNLAAVDNSANFIVTLSNSSHAQATIYSIPDVGAATGQILNKTSAFVSGNIISASGTAGVTMDGGIAANKILTSSITTPDVGSNLIAFTTSVFGATLSSGGQATIFTSSGSKHFAIRDLKVSITINFSGGGGNRLIQITDGTTVYSLIPAASLTGTLNSAWGSAGLPFPASVASSATTQAGASLVIKYSGGTTDYTIGTIVVSGIMERTA